MTATRPPKTLRTLDQLVVAGLLDAGTAVGLQAVADRYAIAVTGPMADLAATAPDGPVARQFVPDRRELDHRPGEDVDPIGDGRHEKVPGLVHRYPDRVLMKLTYTCPVYCRFCFRREMVGKPAGQLIDDDAIGRMIDYVAAHPEIFEIILTGGDPLVLSERRIASVTAKLSAIPHVAALRWHTRVPVVAPDRITPAMVAALRSSSKAVYIGIHTNHADELTGDARAAIARMADAGLALLSQTVLLKGINDDAATLDRLFRALVALRVRPYYLHHADLAPGTAHFRTTIETGQAIMRELRGRLSGIAQPTYVLDIPGGVAKVPVGPSWLDGGTVTAPDGTCHDIAVSRG
ncbi:MAG TPA: lysine-2,3-aminomutase-like protein [Hyphomicrobiaceae bacterium]|nr:lysine-2,3-aminomutase-like protein [Hyphomicrobiaceae bacterium]